MNGLHVTGPIKHYVSFPGANVAYLLGTSVTTPKIRVDRAYLPVHMEQGGYVMPFDLAYQGKTAKIFTILNYYETKLTYLLGCSPRYGRTKFALGRGLDSYRDIGSFTIGNGAYFTLYLEFPFANTSNAENLNTPVVIPGPGAGAVIGLGLLAPAEPINAASLGNQDIPGIFPQAATNIPRWYRFPACITEYEDITGGTGDSQMILSIGAQRIYYTRSAYKLRFNESPLAGGFFLYDHRPPENLSDTDSTLAPQPTSMLNNQPQVNLNPFN